MNLFCNTLIGMLAFVA